MPAPLKSQPPALHALLHHAHGVHCRVGLHDLMGILRILCNQVVASLHDVLKLWVLYVFCPSLDV